MEFPEGSSSIDISMEENVIVVRIPGDVELDVQAARQINREFMQCVRRDDVTAALTVLGTDDVMSSPAFGELENAAAAGFGLGVSRWGIVVGDPADAATFAEHIVGIETRYFETEEAALAWLADV